MRVPTVDGLAPVTPPAAHAGGTIGEPADPDGWKSVVAAVRTALPEHRYSQDELTELIGDLCLAPGADRTVLRRLHGAAGVRTRHLALPLDRYAALGDFGETNAAWMAAGLELGERALTCALEAAGLTPSDVDLVVCTSITGIAAPSLDARLASRMGMRPDVKRIPVFGLGCVAGAAGLARIHDYLRGHQGDVAVLLSVELCSLTLQQRDDSPANLVAGALFGDGAAAVVAHAARADDHRSGRPVVVATRSLLYPDTEHLLGWTIGAGGSGRWWTPPSPMSWGPGSVRTSGTSWPSTAWLRTTSGPGSATPGDRGSSRRWHTPWTFPTVPSTRPTGPWPCRGTCPPPRYCGSWRTSPPTPLRHRARGA